MPSRWERGKKNLKAAKVTSSTVAKTEWINPLKNDKKNHYAMLKVGKTVKFGVGWRF